MIIPSIDLEGGRAVKRVQGRRGQYVYVGNPLELAERFKKAPLVHIVDLDGAEAGRPVNIEAAGQVAAALGGRCQLGGGLRDVEAVGWALSHCQYAVVGSLPFKNPQAFREAAGQFGERLVVSIDYGWGHVLTEGWTRQAAGLPQAVSLLRRHAPYAALVVTAVEVEGTGGGVKLDIDVAMLKTLAKRLYYAGGVKTCGDVETALAAGFDGVIVGYALYKGDLTRCYPLD
ncbi:MAG: 1-(5-phosphoribosyl)-5-[(5-phosphoribosylamino)methylideneamino] imidazole-4-carboxamide isomerase [Pyrobaculum sp.]